MTLSTLSITAVVIFVGTLLLVIGCSYLAYRLKRKSTLDY